jgi:pimeloyl-ACP methyl ester carboxylesterase
MPNSYTLDVDGACLNYQVYGAGQPLLIIGAKPRDAEYLEPLIGALAGDFTVVALELRGIDIIPDELHPEPTPERRADDVAALIDVLGAGPTNVFGVGAGAARSLSCTCTEARRP